MWENGEYLPVILNRIPKKKEDDKINIVCCDVVMHPRPNLKNWIYDRQSKKNVAPKMHQ